MTLEDFRAATLREPTPDELAEIKAAEARNRADEIRRTQRERDERFAAFLGERIGYRHCTFHGWTFAAKEVGERQRVVVRAAEEFAAAIDLHRQQGIGALFYGPPGTGKDYLATCLMRQACLTCGHTARFVNGVEWFVALRESIDGGAKSESDVLREVVRPDWIVLSDPLPPGDAPLTPYQAQMLYRLIDERSSHGKPSVVTVNVSDGTEAARRMGGATWDRIKDRAWVFACSWPSFRNPTRIV